MSEKLALVKAFLTDEGYEVDEQRAYPPETAQLLGDMSPWRLFVSPNRHVHVMIEDERDVKIAVWVSRGEFKVPKEGRERLLRTGWHYRYDSHLAVRIDLCHPESFQRLLRLMIDGMPEDGDEMLKGYA
jgi:hypothetical protein